MRRPGVTASLLSVSAIVATVLVCTSVSPWMDRAGILAGGLDVHIYREGAWQAVHGDPLYRDPILGGLLYTYTPFSALVFVPALIVPVHRLTACWLGLNLGVLYACVLLCWKLIGYRITAALAGVSVPLALTCVFLEPVRTTLFYGQINLVLMLLVLWDFARPAGSRLRGSGVGLATGIKLVPGYFIVQYLALRQWRAAAVATAALLVSVGLAWLVLPADSRQYWLSTFFHSDRIAPDTDPANQSIRGVLAHLSGGASPLWVWIVLAGSVAAVSFALVARLVARGERLLAVTVAGMTACAVSPFSWGHHWVWFVPLLVHFVHRAQSEPRWWAAAAALFVATGAWTYRWTESFASVGIFLLPKPWHTEPLLENSHVVVYGMVMLYAMVRARGRREVPETGLLAAV